MHYLWKMYLGTAAVLLALPAVVSAHPSGHEAMGALERVLHLLGEHYLIALLALLIGAAAILLRSRSARTTERHTDIGLEERPG